MAPALGNQLRMTRSSRLASEFKVHHKKQSVKMKIEREELKDWRICLEINQKERRRSRICKRLIRPTHLAKSRRESSTTWDMLVHYNFVRSEKIRLITKEKFDLLSIPVTEIRDTCIYRLPCSNSACDRVCGARTFYSMSTVTS